MRDAWYDLEHFSVCKGGANLVVHILKRWTTSIFLSRVIDPLKERNLHPLCDYSGPSTDTSVPTLKQFFDPHIKDWFGWMQ